MKIAKELSWEERIHYKMGKVGKGLCIYCKMGERVKEKNRVKIRLKKI